MIPKGERLDAIRKANGERGIWQRRCWEHAIRDERDLNNHIDYCWFNPVKHGFVARAADWPFSSFYRDHRGMPTRGDFEKALTAHALKNDGEQFGERDEHARPSPSPGGIRKRAIPPYGLRVRSPSQVRTFPAFRP
jgi:hypothetical protein